MYIRYGSVSVSLARRILSLQEGDRLDPVGKLADEFKTGRGTIQAALKLLIDEQAIEIEALGKRGSFLKKINRDKLLELGELNSIIGVMPTVHSLVHHGLSLGLQKTFDRASIPLILAQLRGAKNRLHFLRTGRCDFAVISKLSWEEEVEKGDLQLVFEFGAGSNVTNHALLMRQDVHGIENGMKFGVDPSSYDLYNLSVRECEGKEVEFVDISAEEAVTMVKEGIVDVTVISEAIQRPPLGFKIIPLQNHTDEQATNTEAVLLVNKGERSIADVILTTIDPNQVTSIQKQIISGEDFF
ncbi:YhfZ family protein [Shouchella sp. JSM 1781072]|uniref:YhfZ family protein n=1 Tax=Shouchella sp. JSM 1781072 TaxID=3344581 RepID=UPI0035C14B42